MNDPVDVTGIGGGGDIPHNPHDDLTVDPFDPFAHPQGDHNALSGVDWLHPTDHALNHWIEDLSRASTPLEDAAAGMLSIFDAPTNADSLFSLHWPTRLDAHVDPLDHAVDAHTEPGAGEPHDGSIAGFDVHAELDRLTRLDAPATHGTEDTIEMSTLHPAEHPTDPAGHTDPTTHVADPAHEVHEAGGAVAGAAGVGLVGAGLAATRAASSGGGNNPNDLDGEDDDDLEAGGVHLEELPVEGAAGILLLGHFAEPSPRNDLHRVHISDLAWTDVANAAVALGHQSVRVADPTHATNVAAAFLLRVRQAFDLLARHPEAGAPLRLPEDTPLAESRALLGIRVFALTEDGRGGGAHPGDLYYRILPDPDGPEGPEKDSVHILRLLG